MGVGVGVGLRLGGALADERCSPPGGGGRLGKVALLTTGWGCTDRSWKSRTGGDGEGAPLTGGGSIGRPAIRDGGARLDRSCVSRTAVLGSGDDGCEGWDARIVRFGLDEVAAKG